MQVIANNNVGTLSILKKFTKKTTSGRLSHYCVEAEVEEGVLLFHTLTKELLLLSEEEYANLYQNDYLKDHFFVVPEDTKEKEYTDLVRWMLTSRQKKTTAITGYTILPTTDCNARCFYCFELGRSRIPMTKDVALKVVEYIKTHCEGKAVSISWFGGEPLFNTEAIDVISDGLRDAGVVYKSSMISNGYLFDDETVAKAANQWNLKRVQITLDGTEQVYNKAKAYIYDGESPYQIVLSNIERLANAGIHVTIRLNMDLYNAENLLHLVDELAARFAGKKNVYVYAHHLFDIAVPMAQMHTDEEWKKRDAAMRQLEDKIRRYGLATKGGISRKLRLLHCKADNDGSVMILPDGKIGLCEHHTEDELIGHIDSEGFDEAVIESWKERVPEIPECAECFYYPDCVKIKKCIDDSVCYSQYRDGRRRKVQQSMINEYENWKNKEELAEEEAEDC